METSVLTSRRYALLTRLPYIAALVLLFANDFVFKAMWHNTFTGKCSDFAGLFACSVFFMAMFQGRERTIAACMVSAFAWWKSPASQPLIDLANHIGITIDRTVDSSDLAALIMVPLALMYVRSAPSNERTGLVAVPVFCLSCFAFTATSMPPKPSLLQEEAANGISNKWPREETSFSYWPTAPAITVLMRKDELLAALNRDARFLHYRYPDPVPIFLFFLADYVDNIAVREGHLCRPYRGFDEEVIRDTTVASELQRASTVPILLSARFTIEDNGASAKIHVRDILICNFKGSNAIGKETAFQELVTFFHSIRRVE